jgi:hypothetical protein
MNKKIAYTSLFILSAAQMASAACITSYSIGGESIDFGPGCVVEISKTKNDNFLKIVKDNGGSNVDTKEVSVYDIDAGKEIALNGSQTDSKAIENNNDLTIASNQNTSVVDKAMDTVSSAVGGAIDTVNSAIDTILVTLGMRDSVEDRTAAQHNNDPENRLDAMDNDSRADAEDRYNSLPSDSENQNIAESAAADAAVEQIVSDSEYRSDIDDTILEAEINNIIDTAVENDSNIEAAQDMGFTPDFGPDLEPFGGDGPSYTPDDNNYDSVTEGPNGGDGSSDSGSGDGASASIGSDDTVGGNWFGGARKILEEMFGLED